MGESGREWEREGERKERGVQLAQLATWNVTCVGCKQLPTSSLGARLAVDLALPVVPL